MIPLGITIRLILNGYSQKISTIYRVKNCIVNTYMCIKNYPQKWANIGTLVHVMFSQLNNFELHNIIILYTWSHDAIMSMISWFAP
jgi:hypothetical protein